MFDAEGHYVYLCAQHGVLLSSTSARWEVGRICPRCELAMRIEQFTALKCCQHTFSENLTKKTSSSNTQHVSMRKPEFAPAWSSGHSQSHGYSPLPAEQALPMQWHSYRYAMPLPRSSSIRSHWRSRLGHLNNLNMFCWRMMWHNNIQFDNQSEGIIRYNVMELRVRIFMHFQCSSTEDLSWKTRSFGRPE